MIPIAGISITSSQRAFSHTANPNTSRYAYASSSRLELKRERDVDIAEVARCSGVPASTLRFCEEKGLIAFIGSRGLRRLFDPGILERLPLFALGGAAGPGRTIAWCASPR